MTNQTRVAVVDDDPRVRESLESLLDAAQIEAHFFPSAESFLAEDIGRFTCLVSDVKMPGMSGFELQRHVLDRRPSLPIIFISAYPDNSRISEAISLGAITFLQKPFDGEELLGWIEKSCRPLK